MAEITWFFAYRHLRSEASSHVITFRRGQRVRSGRGLAFWFRPDRTSIAEVPADDRDTDFVFQARSRDYQVVTVQGTITWRAAEPEALASRVDFTIDLRTGRLRTDPLDRIASLLIGLAQYQAARYVEHRPVHDLLAEGAAPLQDGIAASLAADPRLREMGLSVVTVRIAGLSPSAELARALETPTFERAQGLADEAAFARRAQAVEKERAIAENELSTKVELARRQAALIAQEDENARRQAEGRAEAGRIASEAEASRIRVVEAARNAAEGERLALLRDTDPAVLQSLVLRAFAEKLTKIETLNITPDLTAALNGVLRGRDAANPAPPAAPRGNAPGGVTTGL
ncbi:SPFH domain-containing protein [Roseomonas populi]|uniref:SPFH domain-containing protein n=1 Tax=Roseomonas populi TaxID=3121582 RepID=A0ABT1X079_9PROT|nr:SPFH domain-containing protein [Roseomonas pecuniae]MCR0981196.1 SPFH domain-containing protein [Roseomonas pecuniae]